MMILTFLASSIKPDTGFKKMSYAAAKRNPFFWM